MDITIRGNVFLTPVIVIGITALIFTGCRANPQFDLQPQYVQFNESTSNGAVLFVLRATDANVQNEMTFNTDSAETNEYVNISQTSTRSPATANIILKKYLDRESHEAGITLKFSLTDTKGNTITKAITLYILDVCDERPKFDTLSYTLEINETSVTIPTLVFTKIHATDKDNGNFAVITYEMKPKAESEEWERMYREMFTIDPLNGSVILKRSLDYEKNSFYQFTVYAHDTCNLTAESADLIIKVKDVQDTPPFFVGLPYISNIIEGTRDNTVLLRVRALDGDRGIPNAISYILSTSSKICHDHFAINASTGEIFVRGALDWGMEELRQIYGVCIFIVEAREMDKHPGNQKGNTVSSTTVTLTIFRSSAHALNLQPCVYNPMNCSCICTEQQNVGPNIVG